MRLVALVVMTVALANRALACPACKDSFAGGQNASIGEAYSWSILFMLGVPITIVSVAAVVITRRLRQHPNSITS